MGLAQFGVCKPLTASNPMFGTRRLSLNRYESVVALTPNITLDLTQIKKTSASRRSVGIDAALDLSQAFVVAVNHASDCDRASDDDGNDRN